MSKRNLPLSKVYTLLESGPVIMLTTASKEKQNVMTLSWHTMIDFEPPIIGCVVSNRSYTFNILKTTKECVINIPDARIADKVVKCGNCSGRKVNKFDAFELTPVKASTVKAPLIDECYVNLECKVIDASMTKKYNLFILKVLKAWINPKVKTPRTIHHYGGTSFMVAGKTIRIASKMK